MNHKELREIKRSNYRFSVAIDHEGNGVAVALLGNELVPLFCTESVKDWSQRKVFENLFMIAKYKYFSRAFALRKHLD